jgi:hypothetical protein
MSGVLKPTELELNILNGELVFSPLPNFSYKTIPVGCYMKISEYQEMILYNQVIVDGILSIDGDLVILE